MLKSIPNTNNAISLSALSDLCKSRLKKITDHYLNDIPSPELKSAMAYALSNTGKQLRPLLVYATGSIFNAPLENLDVPACSIELIHTYSLIHDDLPCMDNADLRRGSATCHKVFGEGLAVLTGDALHTLAMQILAAQPAALSAEQRTEMIAVLSTACGPFGMAAGQALDIILMQNTILPPETLTHIYRLKTGSLFAACIELGRIASGNQEPAHQQALAQFGQLIGLAFQIQDDILDIESSTEMTGKPQGIDAINNKSTYPLVYGLDEAKQAVRALYTQAIEYINYLGDHAALLRSLTGHILQQNNSA
ncbi:MAG TPA: farnesyl diphosphate synthase [Gammaproteobacteria bacterium]|jgi:farnesyl diphosphate synthase|nr:farnesyl diphosphate synthase [Gammaproteobacteria bacterium]